MLRPLRLLPGLLLGVGCPEFVDVCCLEPDGTLVASREELADGAPQPSLCGNGTRVNSTEPFSTVGLSGAPEVEAANLRSICGTVCCQTGSTREVTSAAACEGTMFPESECSSQQAQTCRCSEGTFAIASGCQGGAFADATQQSFCESHCEFNLGIDPGLCIFENGQTFGFPECQVTITCQ